MLEKVFFNIMNFPYIVSQKVLSMNMIVSITILIALILFVRVFLRKADEMKDRFGKILCVKADRMGRRGEKGIGYECGSLPPC